MDQKTVVIKVLEEMESRNIFYPIFRHILKNYLLQVYAAGVNEGNNFGAHKKTIGKYGSNGELIEIYSSAKQASVLTEIDHSNITKAARGNISKAGGFFWKYLKEDYGNNETSS